MRLPPMPLPPFSSARFRLSMVGLYFVLAVAFAGLYCLMPSDFYHSTVQFEDETTSLVESIGDALHEDLSKNVLGERVPNVDVPVFNGWRLNAFSFYDVRLEGSWLLTHGLVIATNPQLGGEFVSRFDLSIRAAGGINTPIFLPGRDEKGQIVVHEDPHPRYVREVRISEEHVRFTGASRPITFQQLFPCKAYPGVEEYCAELSESTDQNLTRLKNLLSGRPTQGDFARMLYLSIVTITTLGSGDIVPLTARARAAVTVEAALGPLLIGVLLASLGATPRGEERENQSKKSTEGGKERPLTKGGKKPSPPT